MKKMTRIMAFVLSVMMLLAVLSACGQAASNSGSSTGSSAASSSAVSAPTSSSSAASNLPPVTLTWMYEGNTVTNDTDVMAKVNEYLKEKLNVTLKMIWCGWTEFDEKARIAISGGDPNDIYFTSSWTSDEYAQYSKNGAFVRLDNPDNNLLDKYAPGLFNSLDPILAQGAMTQGAAGMGVYAVPTYKELAQEYTWDLNVDLLKKYGYTEADVNDYYSFGPMLEKIKQGEGKNFYPLNVEPAVLERMVNSNDVVDGGLLLSYEFDPVDPTKSGTDIKSRYETPGYKKFIEQTRDYYLKGYIDPQMASSQTMATARTAAQLAGKYAIGTQVYSPGYEFQASTERKINVAMKPAQSAIISTTVARGAMQAISTTSANPDRAMMFLNLLNTDPKLFTLLEYGIEGVQYTLTSDGRVKLDPEKRKEYAPWRNGMGKLFQLPVLDNEPVDMWAQYEKFNKAGKPVPILGWAFDQEPVKTQISALTVVAKEYADALNAGSVDPATKLPEFITKLKANGIDQVVTEANNQVKAFLAAKGK